MEKWLQTETSFLVTSQLFIDDLRFIASDSPVEELVITLENIAKAILE